MNYFCYLNSASDFNGFGSNKSSFREPDWALKDTFFLFRFRAQSLQELVLKNSYLKSKMSHRGSEKCKKVSRNIWMAPKYLTGQQNDFNLLLYYTSTICQRDGWERDITWDGITTNMKKYTIWKTVQTLKLIMP